MSTLIYIKLLGALGLLLFSSEVLVLTEVQVVALERQHATDEVRSGMLTERGTEYCGSPKRADYRLYLAVNEIEYQKTKAYSPQTDGICEPFHRALSDPYSTVTLFARFRG